MAQAGILDKVRDYTQGVARETASEFETVIRGLDAAEVRLRETLNQLRATIVEPSLRPPDEDSKSLVDFVDETGVQTLLSTIKEGIDTAHESGKEFRESVKALEDETTGIKDLISSAHLKPGNSLPTFSPSSVPQILHAMESDARDLAANLESLVKHFDLCVTAVKHTLGGGAAATSALAHALPDGVAEAVGELSFINDPPDAPPPSPPGPAERIEMLAVLVKDAPEVDAVVSETRAKALDMETDFERVIAHGEMLANAHADATRAFGLLDDAGMRLPAYVTRAQMQLIRWEDERAALNAQVAELEGLRGFYTGFLRAYDGLLVEVGRRADMRRRVGRTRVEAQARLDKMVEEEGRERAAFRREWGEWLPVDLWPGLTAGPGRLEIVEREPEGGEGSVPDVAASVIRRAIKRMGESREADI